MWRFIIIHQDLHELGEVGWEVFKVVQQVDDRGDNIERLAIFFHQLPNDHEYTLLYRLAACVGWILEHKIAYLHK